MLPRDSNNSMVFICFRFDAFDLLLKSAASISDASLHIQLMLFFYSQRPQRIIASG